MEELVEPVLEVGRLAGRKILHEIAEQQWIGPALDQRRQSSRLVKADDQRTGPARLVEQSPPTYCSELFAPVNQDRVPFGQRSWQLVASSPQRVVAAPRDPDHRDG